MGASIIDARFVYIVHELQLFGFASTAPLIELAALDRLIADLAPLQTESSYRGGVRNVLDSPVVAALAAVGPLRMIAEAVLGSKCFATGGILFDKACGANWKVGWHQDTTIAVRERRDAPGYSAWSEKAGVIHVQPPVEVLQRMLSIRLHLDACGEENGPMRVLSATHMLVFKPLLLHASASAVLPEHRRVIQIEFAADPLPGGLHWRWQIGAAAG